MHKTRLRQIKKIILAEPKKFDMSDFTNYCNSACCIGGHGVLLAGMAKFKKIDLDFGGGKRWSLVPTKLGERINDEVEWDTEYGFESMYRESLKLTQKESIRLFVVDEWPAKFRRAYERANDDADFVGRAKVAAKRIDHFIATGK